MSYDEALAQTGWLHKKSSSVFGGFQKKYFSISPENKLLFADTKGGKPKGILDLDYAKVQNETENSFKIHISDKEFLFKAESTEEKGKWIAALNAVISHEKKPLASSFNTMDSGIVTKRTFEGVILSYKF